MTLPLDACENLQIDYYKNAEGWQATATCSLPDLIEAIRSDEFAATVGEVRALIRAGDKPAADILKKQLPAVSLSGCVKGRRKAAVAEGRFEHSGLLQIDLDAKDNTGWTVEAMRDALTADPRIIAVFVTPSGEGVKGVARIPADAATHKAAFLAAEAHFKTLNLKIDPSCKDPVRLCFVSHDPQAWLRMDTDEMFLPADEPEVLELGEDEESRDPNPETRREPNHRISPAGGLVIRGNAPRELDAATVSAMLRVIPPRPAYAEWLKVASAVWDALGEADGTAALCAWSPEEKPGEYAAKFEKRLTDVHAATLVMRAQENGWSPVITSSVAPRAPRFESRAASPEAKDEDAGKKDKNTIPPHVFPVPAGDIGNDLAACHIFSIIGPTNRLFIRGGRVHRVEEATDGEAEMKPVSADLFVSEIERFGCKIMRREMREDGNPRWRSTPLPENTARMLLASSAAREGLPAIRQLLSAAILVPDGTRGARVLGRGYHEHGGGTFITHHAAPEEMTLAEAVPILMQVLADFEFAAIGDAARAMASLISPALKTGGWIDDDFPLDVAEADQSQAGKSYRHRLIAAIYRETASTITNSTGGVGSLDERVAAALIAGRPFIMMDNFRGRMDSQTLESALRGQGRVIARGLRVSVDVDCSPFLWQLGTNGADLTRDLANRSIITRIRKRAEGHAFQVFPEGDIIAHVKSNQPRYLGAIHAVIRAWAAQGCPRTDESRHDFRLWCRSLDWISQNLMGLGPLLDGHREEQMRTANPKLQWLRDVINALLATGHQRGTGLSAGDLAEAAEEADLPLPGRKDTTESADLRVGKLLGRLFRESDGEPIVVDGRRFSRVVEMEYEPVNRNHRERKTYVIDAEKPVDDEGPETEQKLNL